MYVCVCVCECVNVRVGGRKNRRTHKVTHIYTCIHINILTYIDIHTNVYLESTRQPSRLTVAFKEALRAKTCVCVCVKEKDHV
jgi:hypothetical protein